MYSFNAGGINYGMQPNLDDLGNYTVGGEPGIIAGQKANNAAAKGYVNQALYKLGQMLPSNQAKKESLPGDMYKVKEDAFKLSPFKADSYEQTQQTQQEDFRKKQMELIAAMQARAAGTGGPSLAEMQLKQGSEQNLAGLQAAMASNRGLNPGIASRLYANQYAQEQNRVNQEAAMLRANEQLQAQQLLAQTLGQGRSQDMEAAKLAQYYSSLGFDQAKAQLLANIELERLKQTEFGRAQGLQFGKDQASDSRVDKYIGAGIGAAGAIGAALIGAK